MKPITIALLVTVEIVLVAVAGYLVGVENGINVTIAAYNDQCDARVQTAIDETARQGVEVGAQMGMEEAGKYWLPQLQACLLETNSVHAAIARLIYEEEWDDAVAYDLLWCIMGDAHPLEDCRAMLAEARQ
ncbi:MAG TPA: hypothetical protein VIH05_08115 [Tepidiformaceae bacterium]